jgi:hypothetical protein
MSENALNVDFQVTAPSFHVNPSLALDKSQWGLWDWDVVEVFLGTDPDQPEHYYEFQLSPLGQYFELEIHKPRVQVSRDFVSGFRHAVETSGTKWTAHFELPLTRLGWKGPGSPIVGNVFAILGPPQAKTYWSLFLPAQDSPDFHLPGFFRSLNNL